MHVSLQLRAASEPPCRGLSKHKHWLEWLRSASVAVSEPNCIADVCSVNCLSINGRGKPLYRTYEMFFGGYSTLKNYHMTFYIRHVTCKCENPVSTAGLRIINFLIIKYKIWIKTASFCEIGVSIRCIFNSQCHFAQYKGKWKHAYMSVTNKAKIRTVLLIRRMSRNENCI